VAAKDELGARGERIAAAMLRADGITNFRDRPHIVWR
jgi:hypothetical protein